MTTNEGPIPPVRVPPPLPSTRASVRRRVAIITLGCVLAIAFAVGVATSLRQPVKAGAESSTKEAGITHIHDTVDSVPWSIHVVKIDRSRKDLSFYTPIARGTVLGVSRISELAREVPASLGKEIGRASCRE